MTTSHFRPMPFLFDLDATPYFLAWIPGSPVPWQRTRGRGSRRFTAPADRVWRTAVGYYANVAMRSTAPTAEPVALGCEFFFKRPARGKLLFPTGPHDPDLDNLEKAVADALQGIVYDNDRQVVGRLPGGKTWAWRDEDPGVMVNVRLVSYRDLRG